MKKYYELDEDLYIKGRWHLRGPAEDQQRDERDFRNGSLVNPRGPLHASIHTAGKALDFTQTTSVVPVLSARFANAIRPLVSGNAQLFPVQITGYSGFEVLNPIHAVCCVDEARSNILRFTESDGRPDKIGHYLMIRKLLVDPNRIPDSLHVFRIKDWEIALIVSQDFVDTILPLNLLGPKLKLVT